MKHEPDQMQFFLQPIRGAIIRIFGRTTGCGLWRTLHSCKPRGFKHRVRLGPLHSSNPQVSSRWPIECALSSYWLVPGRLTVPFF